MQSASTSYSCHSHLDLETIRETLLYALSDATRVPSLSGIAAAMQRTIEEIEAVQARAPVSPAKRFRIVSFIPRAAPQARAAVNSLSKSEPCRADVLSAPGDDAVKPKLRSARIRTGYGDRAFLQQAITDFVKSRRS